MRIKEFIVLSKKKTINVSMNNSMRQTTHFMQIDFLET